MGKPDSKEDDAPQNEKKKPPTTPHKKKEGSSSYCFYIPTLPSSGNLFQSNCPTTIWHWDQIPPYRPPVKKG
jgi:hypothetical protein